MTYTRARARAKNPHEIFGILVFFLNQHKKYLYYFGGHKMHKGYDITQKTMYTISTF